MENGIILGPQRYALEGGEVVCYKIILKDEQLFGTYRNTDGALNFGDKFVSVKDMNTVLKVLGIVA